MFSKKLIRIDFNSFDSRGIFAHLITRCRDAVSYDFQNFKACSFVSEHSLIEQFDTDSGYLQVELESARQEMQFLEDAAHIRATRSGVFSNRTISAGQNVEKNDNLAEVISVKNLRVTATLFPRHETKLVGKRATINLPEGGSISGTVVKEFPQRTSEAATIVRIEGRDLNRYMKPGDTVNGNIVLLLHKAVLSVPQSAIIRDEKEKTYVFLKRSGNFTKHPVKTGIKSDSWIEVLSGLKEKDEIVVQGAYELFYRNFNKIYKALD